MNDLRSQLTDKDKEITSLTKEKQLLQSNLNYHKNRVEEMRNNIDKIKDLLEDEKIELELHKKDIELKQKELEYLESILKDEKTQTFANGKYADEVRLTVMELLSMNVSINKVNAVIKVVLNRLAKKDIDRLPSKSLKSQMLIEARHLADIQIGQAMLQGNDLSSVLGNTLHGDGTTKYHCHYQNFQVNTAEGVPLSVGLIEIVDQDAQTVLSVWKERILEIAQVICN